jgi:hypothetical protein
MSKSQQRGNREAKKPKKGKIKVIAAAPSRKAAMLPLVPPTDTAFRSHKSRGYRWSIVTSPFLSLSR